MIFIGLYRSLALNLFITVVFLLVTSLATSASYAQTGNRIYFYDAGCAQFTVYEKLPEVVRGIANGPAIHTLVVSATEPGSILDGVGIPDVEAENIDPVSFGEAFDTGFIDLSRVPNGVRMVVMAQDPTLPFAWRMSAKCHKGSVGLMHYDKVFSTKRTLPPAEVAMADDILLGKPSMPRVTPKETAANSSAPQRNDIDAELAALAEDAHGHQELAAGYGSKDEFAEALFAADEDYFRS